MTIRIYKIGYMMKFEAYELKESEDKNICWIGKNALKELETLVSVKERGRLLTSKSKIGSRQ